MDRDRFKSILSLDTSYLWVSSSYYKDGKIFSCFHLRPFSHVEMLNTCVLKVSEIPERLPDVVLINIGPGFFTSLRVSASFVKALLLYRKIPVFGFNTLQSMLVGLPPGKYISFLDARKGEIYAQSFLVKDGIPYPTDDLPLGIYKPEEVSLKGYVKYSGYIRAMNLIRLFFNGFGEELDENFVPLYLRPPDAIVNLAAPRAPSNP